MPDNHAALLDGLSWARVTPLPDRGELNRIGIIVSNRTPMSPLAQTVLTVARQLELPASYGAR
jgi:hypothetical protein